MGGSKAIPVFCCVMSGQAISPLGLAEFTFGSSSLTAKTSSAPPSRKVASVTEGVKLLIRKNIIRLLL